MSNTVLVINSGSSSIKFSAFKSNSQFAELEGLAQNLNSPEAVISWKLSRETIVKGEQAIAGADHKQALQTIMQIIAQCRIDEASLVAVGHRVVHGGEKFSNSVKVTNDVLSAIEQCSYLAPLHNPANVMGINTMRDLFPNLPQVAVFDTAFHQTLEPAAYLYGLPYEWYEKLGVRRYGFHGTSHRYVTQKAADVLGMDLSKSSYISAHLGNGCSAAAVLNGCSVDTTMGMTPLEGLIMGTRCGDIDPSLHEYLMQALGLSIQELNEALNKESGLLGLSGLSNDMRLIEQQAAQGHKRANLAIDVFCHKLAKSIAGLAASLDRIDALIFTGGIGENSVLVRARVLQHLQALGFRIDQALNESHGGTQGVITLENSTKALVLKTNEEWMIAQDSFNLL